jgi:ATP-dependent exoDNAse (exonuclease V) beta subunit
MGKGTLTIYNASAGSGKTFTLAAVYLNHIFKSRYNYRHILAVTFTNKATAEMKSRILENLHRLGSGKESDYLKGLLESTGKSEDWIRSEAGEILNCILHDYSRFHVSTIDSFFQKILRAFAREAGLNSGFNIELDNSIILSDAVDKVLKSASSDARLKSWLREFALSNIEEEKSWNLKESIIALAQEIFREKFRILSDDERKVIENKDFLLGYINSMRGIISSFEKGLKNFGSQAKNIYAEYGLNESMFFQKGKGVPGFIVSLSEGIVKGPNSYVLGIMQDPPKWTSGKPDPSLEKALKNGLEDLLRDAVIFFQNGIESYNSAVAVLSNIYSLGILSDILKNVREVASSENTFLLSEAGDFLKKITGGDQTSFIYEKAGNRFDSFMIDEFQDTSELQWVNFKPLIENSMAQGYDNLVVGDIKQSIYRWRNSDWKILGSVLKDQTDNERIFSKPLVTNWRSCSDIISFNNSIFSVIPGIVDQMLSSSSGISGVGRLYSEAFQKDSGKRKGGYVRIEFVKDEDEHNWQETVLDKLPALIGDLIKRGYKFSDIGIIVRDSREGARVLRRIIDFNNQPDEGSNLKAINVVSNDSLILSNSPALSFIAAVLAVVINPDDMISRALMLRLFLLSSGTSDFEKVSVVSGMIPSEEKRLYPEGFADFIKKLSSYTLFETTERIIQFFRLNDNKYSVPYLNSFQDLVLSYSSTRGNDLPGFIEWWENSGSQKSVVLPDSQDAVRILTIHKSKGLEFGAVILPFISWGLDHLSVKPPVLWVKPSVEPFNRIGIVPVRYGKNLEQTIFRNNYSDEKFSAYIDNINLLYVAFSRARDELYAFSADSPRSENSVAAVLKSAITMESTPDQESGLKLPDHFDTLNGIFELGNPLTKNVDKAIDNEAFKLGYPVHIGTDSLRLRLHGEYYFRKGAGSFGEKINYGLLMHEIFEGIDTVADLKPALGRMMAEGRIGEGEAEILEKKIRYLLSDPVVSGWFAEGNTIMREAGILLKSGATRRPDRIVFREGKTIIIDFKFGDENPHYRRQIRTYMDLLASMGYEKIEGYIWYADKNVVEEVKNE